MTPWNINQLYGGEKLILWVTQCAEIPLCATDPLCRCFLSLLLFSPRHTEASGSQLVGREQNGHHYKHGFCRRDHRWPGGRRERKKKKLPLWTVLSYPAREVTNLTLAGAFLRFKGHFNSFILEDIVFKYLNINNEEMRWASPLLVVSSSDRKHQLFSDLHLKAEAILSKSSTAPLFYFSS